MSQAPPHQRLLAELKRRHVFKVAAVYGAGAFVVLQVADLLQEGLQLPQAFLTAATLVALVGFPVILVLSWLYDRTPHGMRRTPEAAPNEIADIVAQPRARRWPIGIAAAISTALLLVSSWWMLGRPSSPAAPSQASYSSIAVLPFDNMSGNADDAYFADGLSEELLNALTRVPGLRVAGRTSSFSLRHSGLDIPAIGDTLGVETVLEGSVRRAAGRVRITAQLVDASDGFHLWSKDWERELTADNVFDIQDEIAGAVARALATGQEPEALDQSGGRAEVGLVPASVRTADLGAYELYLAGRHHWATRTPTGLREAVRLFEAALERDSMYAPAWVGLSAAYNALPWYTDFPPTEGAERSISAAHRALALDPDNAEALYTLATTRYEFDRAWEDAADLFRRAIALDPAYSQGLGWYCYYLVAVGRWTEAEPWCERSVELDPLRVHGLVGVGEVLLISGRYEESLRSSARALAIQPGFGYPLMNMALASARLGRLDEAQGLLASFNEVSGVGAPAASAAAVIAGLRDPVRRDEAVAAVREWEAYEEVRSWMVIDWLAILGARSEALEEVDRLVREQPPDLSSLNGMVATSLLRGDPRFDAAIAALHIPDPPPEAEPIPW